MSFVHDTRRACVGHPAASVWQLLSAALRRITAPWLQARRARATSDALHALDDHLLFDIGLARAELQWWAVTSTQANPPSP